MIFTYYFTVDHVHDGDTVYGVLDVGLGIYLGRPTDTLYGIRFYGINAPELPTVNGYECRDYLETLVKPGDVLRVDSFGWDKYAWRVDGVPWTTDKTGLPVTNLCAAMLEFGHGTVVYK